MRMEDRSDRSSDGFLVEAFEDDEGRLVIRISKVGWRPDVTLAEGLVELHTSTLVSFPTFDRHVQELELSVRSRNCMQNARIKFIGDLVQKSEADLLGVKNFGRKSLKEFKEILAEMGLHLGMTKRQVGGWIPPDERREARD